MIAGSTAKRLSAGFAPIAIGLALTLIHLISIPVTNTSVNPARSTAVAVYVGGWAIAQLWLFWVAPIVGGAIGGKLYDSLFGSEGEGVSVSWERVPRVDVFGPHAHADQARRKPP